MVPCIMTMAMRSTANGKGCKKDTPLKVNGNVNRKIRIAKGKGTSTGEYLRTMWLNLPPLLETLASCGGSTSSCSDGRNYESLIIRCNSCGRTFGLLILLTLMRIFSPYGIRIAVFRCHTCTFLSAADVRMLFFLTLGYAIINPGAFLNLMFFAAQCYRIHILHL